MGIGFATRLLDFIAPRLCVVCGKRLSPSEEYVCGTCLLHLPRTGFHNKPLDNIMAQMFWGQMPTERATALFFYKPDTDTSKIIMSLKYNNNPGIGVAMGRIMASEVSASGFFDGIDMIMSVPLAKQRLRQRGYNQSEMLAQGISEITGINIDKTTIIRTAFKESQTRLHRRERMENVSTLFALNGNGENLSGKHILLVDDVATTGATLIACASAMKDITNVKFSVITLGFTHS